MNWLESDSKVWVVQNLNRDVVVIHHHKEITGEKRKITQMISSHGMAKVIQGVLVQ